MAPKPNEFIRHTTEERAANIRTNPLVADLLPAQDKVQANNAHNAAREYNSSFEAIRTPSNVTGPQQSFLIEGHLPRVFIETQSPTEAQKKSEEHAASLSGAGNMQRPSSFYAREEHSVEAPQGMGTLNDNKATASEPAVNRPAVVLQKDTILPPRASIIAGNSSPTEQQARSEHHDQFEKLGRNSETEQPKQIQPSTVRLNEQFQLSAAISMPKESLESAKEIASAQSPQASSTVVRSIYATTDESTRGSVERLSSEQSQTCENRRTSLWTDSAYQCPNQNSRHNPSGFEEINKPAHQALSALKQVVQEVEAERTLTRESHQFVSAAHSAQLDESGRTVVDMNRATSKTSNTTNDDNVLIQPDSSKTAGTAGSARDGDSGEGRKTRRADEQIDGCHIFVKQPKGGRQTDTILDSIETRVSGKDKVQILDLTDPKERRALAELIKRLQTGTYSPEEFKDLTAVLREANKVGIDRLTDLRIRLTTREPDKILQGLDTKTQIQLREFIAVLVSNVRFEQRTEQAKGNRANRRIDTKVGEIKGDNREQRIRELSSERDCRTPASRRIADFKNQLVDVSGRDQYTVQKGQTLGWIALKHYNDDRIALLIAELNGYPHANNKIVRQPETGAKLMLPTAEELEKFNVHRKGSVPGTIGDARTESLEGQRKAVTTCRKCGCKHSGAELCKDTIRRAAERGTFVPTVLSNQTEPLISHPFN